MLVPVKFLRFIKHHILQCSYSDHGLGSVGSRQPCSQQNRYKSSLQNVIVCVMNLSVHQPQDQILPGPDSLRVTDNTFCTIDRHGDIISLKCCQGTKAEFMTETLKQGYL